jgi:hypothetical protein
MITMQKFIEYAVHISISAVKISPMPSGGIATVSVIAIMTCIMAKMYRLHCCFFASGGAFSDY